MKTHILNFRKTIAVFIAMMLMILSVSYSGNKSEAANTSQRYWVYNAQTGKFLRRYTLNPISSDNNQIQQRTYGIVGTDDREPDKECNGVVFIIAGSETGTGFIIDDHVIVTAAHCLYDEKNDKSLNIKKISVLDKSGSVELNATPVEFHIPKNYIDGYYEYDYALITVKEDLSSYPHFELGVALNSAEGATVKVSGFPGIVNDVPVNRNPPVIYTGKGNILDLSETELLVDADATPGNSGGPVYIEENIDIGDNEVEYKTAVGIIAAYSYFEDESNGPNIAVRFTTNHINFYRANKNIQWEV